MTRFFKRFWTPSERPSGTEVFWRFALGVASFPLTLVLASMVFNARTPIGPFDAIAVVLVGLYLTARFAWNAFSTLFHWLDRLTERVDNQSGAEEDTRI